MKIELINIPAITCSGSYLISTNEKNVEWDTEREFQVDLNIQTAVNEECGYHHITHFEAFVQMTFPPDDPDSYRLEKQLEKEIYKQYKDN